MVKMVKIKDTKKIVETNNEGDIFVDGVKYSFDKTSFKKIGKDVHIDKHIFKKTDEEEVKKYKEIIINELKKRTDVEELLNETIKDTPIRELKAIAKRIKSKKQIQKQKGCLAFRIGDKYLALFE